MRYEKVKENKNLVRDTNTNAILNKNMNDYNNYMRMKNSRQNHIEKVEKLETDLTCMKNDIDEIKFLLRKLINEP